MGLSRSQRLGQDHDDPHAVRLLHADDGTGTCLGHDIRTQSEADQARSRLHDPAIQLLGRSSIRENLEFVARVYELRRSPASSRRNARRGWVSPSASTNWRANFPAAGNSAWRWPPACCIARNCFCSTNRPPASIRKARRDFWDEIHRLSEEGLTVLVSTHYMDEAERCDRIVYILNGKIVARGTVAEVIAQSGLITFVVEGEGVRQLVIEACTMPPGVEYVAFFGAALHVSGHDRAALESALAPYRGSNAHRRSTKPRPASKTSSSIFRRTRDERAILLRARCARY